MNLLKIMTPQYDTVIINLNQVTMIDDHGEQWITFHFVGGTTKKLECALYPELLDLLPAVSTSYDADELRARREAEEQRQKDAEERKAKFKAEQETAKARQEQSA